MAVRILCLCNNAGRVLTLVIVPDGTQALAWRINADTVQHDLMRQALLSQADQTRKQVLSDRRGCKEIPSIGSNVTIPPRGLKIFYGSVHDIESYPCEEGDAEMVMAASTCIEGAHGQWIWNGTYSLSAISWACTEL